MKKMKKNIFIFFMLLMAIVLGDEIKIPHERITENPKMEVTTVESKKLKENAKLDISVNKKNIEEIEGIEKDGKIVFILPEDKIKMIRDEEIIVVKSLAELPKTYQGNKRNKRATAKTYSIEEDERTGVKSVTIDKSEGETQVYIALVDKSTGVVNNVVLGNIKLNKINIELDKYQITVDRRLLIKHYINTNGGLADTLYNWNNAMDGDHHPELVKVNKKLESIPEVTGEWLALGDIQNASSHGHGTRLDIDDIETNLILAKTGRKIPGGIDAYYKLGEQSVFLYGLNDETTNKVTSKITNVYYQGNDTNIYVLPIERIVENNLEVVGVAELNLTSLEKDKVYTFDSNETGSVASIEDSTIKLTLKSGKLPQTNGYYTKNITTRLNVSINGTSATNVPGKVYENTNYRISLDNVYGNLEITKLKEDISYSDIVSISYKYKHIVLGTIELEISNTGKIDIGEVIFNVDSRMKNLSPNWINANGEVYYNLTSSSQESYPELIRLDNKFKNLENTGIKDLLSIEGRLIKNTIGAHKVFYVHSSSHYEDESAVRFGINLTTLDNNIIISKNNSTDPNMLNNRFILLGENNKQYLGNIKENYDTSSPADGYTGKAELDLTKVDRNKNYTFIKDSVIGEVESQENSKVKLNLVEGKLPQTQGYYNKNILTSIRVSKNGTLVSNSGVNYEDENYSLEFDADGNLIVRKKSIKDYSDNLEIEYMYHDVKLGSLSLKLENSVEVQIVGDNVIDFGKIFQGKKSKIDGKIQIKSSSKIVTVEIDENYAKELVHMGTNEKLPYTARVNAYNQGFEIPVGIEMELEPSDNQELGTYTGEFNLMVTIE